MSSEKIELVAEKRELVGKKVSQVRAAGRIPATMYERGKQSLNVSVEEIVFEKVWHKAGTSHPIELKVDSKSHLAMIKSVDINPAKNKIIHISFHAVNKNDPVEAEIPVKIEGDIPAERVGNFIVRANDHVLVKALPDNLPEFIGVDAGLLNEPGDHITVADIVPIKDVQILSEPEVILAVVEAPRTQEQQDALEAVSVEAAEVPSDNGSDTSATTDKKAE